MWLTDVDHDRREALVALDGDEIVAVARYDGRPGGIDAEIAVTVEDAWQHRGVGTAPGPPARGRRAGPRHRAFIATMLADNREAIGLLRRLSPDATVRFEDGNYEASMPLTHVG